MSGHSKWAQIKRQKGANDAKKGQVFTKLGREITIAARSGVADPDANFRLRLAIAKAREANMPAENVERAIKRATGSGEGATIEELSYEGYGPGGAALLVQVATDNRNRAASEVRNAFTRGGGNLGEAGCVAWLFEPRGVIVVEPGKGDPDEIALSAIDAGADDALTEDGLVEIYTEPHSLEQVRRSLEEQKVKVTSAESTMHPKSSLDLGEDDSIKLLKLMDRLEELDDVQKVYTNVSFSNDILEKYEG
jgi:YebC/PmpR family DNA-binding regulatory protein